ncbi:RNA signal recognition particle [Methyloceanibacter stevinii]|uniref:RNA signal recognition particle n=1 Tax=Methyloceanibacter stevinii TaxID=1774970 RepID=A0A1E3VP13_9HYPH|nr:DUF1428 domain-containing protein [Methyloceanibacter stevinii]ODR95273.1 RNA signal recognition particle [Methyloceanibacter stevinii]
MSYIVAFVAAVPSTDKATYGAHVAEAAEMFKKHGAVRCVECWGVEVPPGKLTSFPLAVKCEPDETVVFGFVEWETRTAHDEGMPKVMSEMNERMKAGTLAEPPFDGKRMIFGGFDVLVDQ